MSSAGLDRDASRSGGVLSIMAVSISLKIILYRIAFTARLRLQREEIVPGRKIGKSAEAALQAAWPDRLRYFEQRQDRMVETVRELVEIESPSDNKQAVDRIAAFLALKFEALGGQSQFHRSHDFGDSLQIDFDATPRSTNPRPVLLLGHYDTVYPLGTLANMP